METTKTEAASKESKAEALARISGKVRDLFNELQNTRGLDTALGSVSGLERLLESAKGSDNPNTLVEFARRFTEVAEATGLEAPAIMQTSLHAAEGAFAVLNDYIKSEDKKVAVSPQVYDEAKRLVREIEKLRESMEKEPMPEPLG